MNATLRDTIRDPQPIKSLVIDIDYEMALALLGIHGSLVTPVDSPSAQFYSLLSKALTPEGSYATPRGTWRVAKDGAGNNPHAEER